MSHGHVLVTGGAGFIGSNLANRLLDSGRPVVVLDDLSRSHVHRNVQWLKRRHGDAAALHIGDVCDVEAVDALVADASAVFHLAARAGGAECLADPRRDFEVNARGTLNVLEAVRRRPAPPLLVVASSHEVYGALADVAFGLVDGRHAPLDEVLRTTGVDEARPLSFLSPHGCSKGAADQYVLDYARTFGLPATVLRLGCVYGPRQFGSEDHGFVAHFLTRALRGAPIALHGDGREVRDLLYVDDLVDALMLALEQPDAVAGRAFNVGGGPAHAVSRLELVDRLGALHGRRPEVRFEEARRAEQRWYVSDVRRFSEALGWRPATPLVEGLRRLDQWLGQLDRNAPPTLVRRRRRVPATAMERT